MQKMTEERRGRRGAFSDPAVPWLQLRKAEMKSFSPSSIKPPHHQGEEVLSGQDPSFSSVGEMQFVQSFFQATCFSFLFLFFVLSGGWGVGVASRRGHTGRRCWRARSYSGLLQLQKMAEVGPLGCCCCSISRAEETPGLSPDDNLDETPRYCTGRGGAREPSTSRLNPEAPAAEVIGQKQGLVWNRFPVAAEKTGFNVFEMLGG